MSADNKQIVLDAYAALNAGNPAGYFDRMVDDVRVTDFGTHRHVRNVVAEGDQAVVEAQGEARAKDGREYMDTELAKAIFG